MIAYQEGHSIDFDLFHKNAYALYIRLFVLVYVFVCQ